MGLSGRPRPFYSFLISISLCFIALSVSSNAMIVGKLSDNWCHRMTGEEETFNLGSEWAQ